MPIEYKYFPLIKPSVIERRFRKDIQLPQLARADNFLVSRSDDSLVIRPDFNKISENLLARSNLIRLGATDESGDFLNSAVGIWGTDSLVFFSRYLPYSATSTASTSKAGAYTTGTVTCTAAGTTLTGVGTSWLQNVWPGCLLLMTGDTSYYLVKSVTDDTHLEITSTFAGSLSGVAYSAALTHSAFHSMYKLNLQTYASGIIYNAPPEVGKNILSRNIHGPLYAGVTESTTTLESEITRDALADWTWETNDEGHFLIQLGVGNNGPWIVLGESTETQLMYSTTTPSIEVNNDWIPVTLTDYQSNITSMTRSAVGGLDKNLCTFGSVDVSLKKKYIGFMGDGDVSGVTFSMGDVYFLDDADLPTISGYSYQDYTPFQLGVAWEEKNLFVYSCLYDDTSDAVVSIHTTPLDTLLEYVVNGTGSAPVWTLRKQIGPAGTFGRTQDILIGGGYCCVVSFNDVAYSSDGITWTEGDTGSTGSANSSAAYSSKYDRWVIINGGNDEVYYASGSPATANWNTVSLTITGFPHFLHWDEVGETFYAVGDDRYFYISKDGIIWAEGDLSGITNYTANDRYAGVAFHTDEVTSAYFIGGNSSVVDICSTKYRYETKTTYASAAFAPVSTLYRACTFSVLDGYVVLAGTSEWSGTAWVYFPRRIRWTAPFTVTDFTSAGSGTADLSGHGAVLDSRPVNGRIVTFETSGIGAISPRGQVSDPWDYERIYEGLVTLSNPVVVEDLCFFIAQDGLLYQTNGEDVMETKASFDMSKFSDWDETTPIWLTYSKLLNSLVAYSPNARDNLAHIVNMNNGSVTSMKLFSATEDNLPLRAITSVEESADKRMLLCYGPDPADTDTLVTLELSPGELITGIDEPTTTAADDNYWHAIAETGEINLVDEGRKVRVTHAIIETYTEALIGTNLDRPDLVVQIRSMEDTEWHGSVPSVGTITLTSSTCTGSGTAFSNLIGRAGEEVTGSEDEFTLPCQASQARVYTELSGTYTLETAYTTSGNTITFTTDPLVTKNLYAFWDAYPEVRAAVGDYIYSPVFDSWHRITAINTATNLTLDHYPPSGSDATAVFYPAGQMPDGEGEVKVGINKLVDSLRVRFIVIPRGDQSNPSTTAKVTGISFGYRPHGKRVLEATGT